MVPQPGAHTGARLANHEVTDWPCHWVGSDLLDAHSDADLLGCVSKARESWNAARRRSTSLNAGALVWSSRVEWWSNRTLRRTGVNVSPSFRSPTKDNGEKRWPGRCEVRPRIIITRVQRSPAPNLMSGPERDLSKSVQQQSNIELEDKEYARGLRALEDVFDAVQQSGSWIESEHDLVRLLIAP